MNPLPFKLRKFKIFKNEQNDRRSCDSSFEIALL